MPRAPPLPAGTKVGEYEIVRELAHGGMGTVYEGRQPLIGKRVAIKLLDGGLAEGDIGFQRFVAEARAVNAVGHRGIVDVFAFGRHGDGRPYMVMEFLEGRTFERLIAERAPLDEGEVLQLGRECLEALGAAHRLGIVHRDLKPSNLFLVEPPHGAPYVKVLDFGIAKAIAGEGLGVQATREDSLLGSPPYMSPEQILGTPVSPPTDLYALGLVLYELLTGSRAVVGPSLIETLRLHAEGPVPRPSERNPRVSPALDALVADLLAKAPEDRPASAERALERLRSAAAALGQPWPEDAPSEALRDLLPLGPAPEPSDAGASVRGGLATDAAAGVSGGRRSGRVERAERATGQSVPAGRSRPPVSHAGAAQRRARLAAFAALVGAAVALAVVAWALFSERPSEARPSAGRREAAARRADAGVRASADAGASRLGSLLGEFRGRGDVIVTVDSPVSGARVTGISPIEGWAVAPEGIEAVELFVDDVSYGAIPYGGGGTGVDNAFPLYRGVRSPRFLMPFNFSELSPGLHRLILRARSSEGRTSLGSLTVDVVRFHDSYIEARERLRLSAGQLRLQGDRLHLEGLLLDALRYDVTLAYSVEAQDFAVEGLTPLGTREAFEAALTDPARSPQAPLGFGFRRPLERAPVFEGPGHPVVLDQPPGGLGRRGTVLLTGWIAAARGPFEGSLVVVKRALEVSHPAPVLGPAWPDLAYLAPQLEARGLVGALRANEWEPGRHRLRVRARAAGANLGDARMDLELAHFEGRWRGPIGFAPGAAARLAARPGAIELSQVVAGPRRYDVELDFLPALQRFSITRITALPEPLGRERSRNP